MNRPPTRRTRAPRRSSPTCSTAFACFPASKPCGALSGGLPLTSNWSQTVVEVPGRTFAQEEAMVDIRQANPGLSEGDAPDVAPRPLARTDRHARERIGRRAERRAARRYLGGENPIGAEIRLQRRTSKVVGVVRGVTAQRPRERGEAGSVRAAVAKLRSSAARSSCGRRAIRSPSSRSCAGPSPRSHRRHRCLT